MITFNFHIGDFVKKTSHLTHEERGIYLSMLMKYYDTEQPLPADIKQVCRIVCVRNADAMRQVSELLEEFFLLTEHGWVNKRVDEEIQKFYSKSEKARNSAKARWNKGSGDPSPAKKPRNAKAMRTHSEGNANHEPQTNIKDSSLKNARDQNSPPADNSGTQSDNSGQQPNVDNSHNPADNSCTGEQLSFDAQYLRLARTTGISADHSDADIRAIFDLFRCYKANANTHKTQSDWLGAWRTWCQREKVNYAKSNKKTGTGYTGQRPENNVQRALRVAQQAAERLAATGNDNCGLAPD